MEMDSLLKDAVNAPHFKNPAATQQRFGWATAA